MIDVEKIAAVFHEANRRYSAETDDISHKPWEETSWAVKQSAIAGVVYVKENPDAPLSFQHDQWCKRKIIDGWMFGIEFNEEEKKHPCIRPYEQLSGHQKVKDRLFRAIVKSLTEGETDV